MEQIQMSNSKIVLSIPKAIRILKSLSNGVDRVSDLAEALELSKSTTHRLLRSLEQCSMVKQDPISRRYYLGPLIIDLASKPIITHRNLTTCAFEDMNYIRDLSRETVVLYIRMGHEKICIEEFQSLEDIRYTIGKGFVAPIYTGSSGKILLSELKNNELQLLLRNLRLESFTPNTITDKKILLNELRKIRRQGYAMSFGERVKGASSISVPISNYVCPVALSIMGPDNRFSLNKMMEILPVTKERAIHISKKLGGNRAYKSQNKF